jgi:Ulp1 family protease
VYITETNTWLMHNDINDPRPVDKPTGSGDEYILFYSLLHNSQSSEQLHPDHEANQHKVKHMCTTGLWDTNFMTDPIMNVLNNHATKLMTMPQPNVKNLQIMHTHLDVPAIQTLKPGTQLRADVLNCWMSILQCRETYNNRLHPDTPRTLFFDTYFMTHLLHNRNQTYNYTKVKNYATNRRCTDILKLNKIIVPIHYINHYVTLEVSFRMKTIAIYDSMHRRSRHNAQTKQTVQHLQIANDNPKWQTKCATAMFQYIHDELKHNVSHEERPNATDWTFEINPEISHNGHPLTIPQQSNGIDCGVFACLFATYAYEKRPMTFTQRDINNYRLNMVWHIMHTPTFRWTPKETTDSDTSSDSEDSDDLEIIKPMRKH